MMMMIFMVENESDDSGEAAIMALKIVLSSSVCGSKAVGIGPFRK